MTNGSTGDIRNKMMETNVVNRIVELLRDKELPVRIEALLTIGEFVEHCTCLTSVAEPALIRR